jgi:SAM-dependent methyltransferase
MSGLSPRYIHTENDHNLKAPRVIVPRLVELFQPKSVIDFGCGVGTFLSVFKEQGIIKVKGIDGNWVDKSLLYRYLNSEEFLENDLGERVDIKEKFDLALCLEVAEHLDEKYADVLVNNLVRASNLIVFSAAVPYQGGQNHINEQWLTYWEKKFQKYNFRIHDILRPLFWENKDIDPWYRQNIVLFSSVYYPLNLSLPEVPMRNLIHPELYQRRLMECKQIAKGSKKPIYYFFGFLHAIFGQNQMSRIKLYLKKAFAFFS